MKSTLLLLCIALASCHSVCGQVVVEPDFDLWGGGVTNPSGLAAIPILQYDPSNGEMWINTVGLNGVSDTTSPLLIGGDDVGFVSISVEGPPAIETAPEFDGFFDGCFWQGQYFNGKQQLWDGQISAHYLTPTAGMRMWTYETGLTPGEFGFVELAVNFQSGGPGGTMIGGVQFVPEPSTVTHFFILVLLMTAFIRRKSP
ncbi:MAG: hypothetical protein AAF497_21525 [Planctomycetota bacterium]